MVIFDNWQENEGVDLGFIVLFCFVCSFVCLFVCFFFASKEAYPIDN